MRIWLQMAVISGVMLVLVFYSQYALTANNNLDNACRAAGYELDRNFRLLHPRDGTPAFPLHNRCDAGYDLVPAWVNPSLSALAAVLAFSLAAALVSRSARRTPP